MKKIYFIIFTSIFLIWTNNIFAFEDDDEEKSNTKIRYKKDTTVEFSDVELEGIFQKPEGYYSLKAKKTKFETLISPKYDFIDELKNSVYSIDEE